MGEDSKEPVLDEKALFKELESESHEFEKDKEIERVLNAFRLDAYAVLDLMPGVGEAEIRQAYRKKSLLIHPDKTRNPSAQDAFDRLAKAHEELKDDKYRARLDDVMSDARHLLIRERREEMVQEIAAQGGSSIGIIGGGDSDGGDKEEEGKGGGKITTKEQALKWTPSAEEQASPAFQREWRLVTRRLRVEDEARRVKQLEAQLKEEGRKQRLEDEQLDERKRKRDMEEQWEQTRDQRIGNWRDFRKGQADGADKKKKKKMKVLG